jgi:diguanylate cyclase (GGDEF)-like protein
MSTPTKEIALLRAHITKLELQADQLRREADTDSLTGLFNRRGLERRTGKRDWGKHVVCDLNGFKAAQDTHPDGHAYGDRVLREFAAYLRQGLREQDYITARNGGDEFAIWCESESCADRILTAVTNWSSKDGRVTASAGAGLSIKEADAACYEDKRQRQGV